MNTLCGVNLSEPATYQLVDKLGNKIMTGTIKQCAHFIHEKGKLTSSVLGIAQSLNTNKNLRNRYCHGYRVEKIK
jgi:hypothetical protein